MTDDRSSSGDFDGGNTTGFASPAGSSPEGPFSLSEMLDLQRPNRYLLRVAGEALIGKGILPGDILIADASASPINGRIAIIMVDGEVSVARLGLQRSGWWIKPGKVSGVVKQMTKDGEVWAVIRGLVRTDV